MNLTSICGYHEVYRIRLNQKGAYFSRINGTKKKKTEPNEMMI